MALTWSWFSWSLPLIGPGTSIFPLLLFGPCLFILLERFVSSRLRQSHVKMMVIQGFQPLPETDPVRVAAELTLGPLNKTEQEFCDPS